MEEEMENIDVNSWHMNYTNKQQTERTVCLKHFSFSITNQYLLLSVEHLFKQTRGCSHGQSYLQYSAQKTQLFLMWWKQSIFSACLPISMTHLKKFMKTPIQIPKVHISEATQKWQPPLLFLPVQQSCKHLWFSIYCFRYKQRMHSKQNLDRFDRC